MHLSKCIVNNWSLWLSFTTCRQHFSGWRTSKSVKNIIFSLHFPFSLKQFAVGEAAALSSQTWQKRCGINKSLSFMFNISFSGSTVLFSCVHLLCMCWRNGFVSVGISNIEVGELRIQLLLWNSEMKLSQHIFLMWQGRHSLICSKGSCALISSAPDTEVPPCV